jgi:hypothetical protein
MSQRRYLPRPMVRRSARLKPDRARGQRTKKLQQLGATQLPPNNHCAPGINPVNLKHVLRNIQPNRANLVHGRLLLDESSTTSSWHIDAVAGAVHLINSTDHEVGTST